MEMHCSVKICLGKGEEDGVRSRSIQPSVQPQVTELTSYTSPASDQSEGVTSYLVASSPEVLSQILRDTESRGVELNPALYTTPANALNTTKVEFAPPGYPPPSPSAHRAVRPSGSGPRSLPGSAHSTLSRGGSLGSLEKGRGVRRKTSFGASLTSGCQVTRHYIDST